MLVRTGRDSGQQRSSPHSYIQTDYSRFRRKSNLGAQSRIVRQVYFKGQGRIRCYGVGEEYCRTAGKKSQTSSHLTVGSTGHL